MDDMVRAALKKWPQRAGLHRLARARCARRLVHARRPARRPPAPSRSLARAAGIEHLQLREFIERNYDGTPDGARGYFQNGPQRVYVELEAAPHVWRLGARAGAAPQVRSHTGQEATVASAWIDERGRLFLATDTGFGIVHTQDMEAAADAVEAGLWDPQTRWTSRRRRCPRASASA